MKYFLFGFVGLIAGFSSYASTAKICCSDFVRHIAYSCTENDGTLHVVMTSTDEKINARYRKYAYNNNAQRVYSSEASSIPATVYSFNPKTGSTIYVGLSSLDLNDPSVIRMNSFENRSDLFSTDRFVGFSIAVNAVSPADSTVTYRTSSKDAPVTSALHCVAGLVQVPVAR